MKISGRTVILGYSGGPDAAALAWKLMRLGARVHPVYVHYRKTGGGKVVKDLRAARSSAKLLGLPPLDTVKIGLGERPKGERNRFFVPILAAVGCEENTRLIALGTFKKPLSERDTTDRPLYDDLDPRVLNEVAEPWGATLITWDTFGVTTKADEFKGICGKARAALFATTSCQMWWKKECGNCRSCLARHEAFLEAFDHDPTIYRKSSKVGRLETSISV